MPFDSDTEVKMQYQARRMCAALAETPPNHREAELIQNRWDNIYDHRPKAIAIAADGEVLYDNQSPLVLAQATLVVNDTGKPEKIVTAGEVEDLTREAYRAMGGPDDGTPLAGASA